MEERIAGEFVVFPAADRSQEFAAGIPIDGHFPGKSRSADDPALMVAVGDLASIGCRGAENLAAGIAVGGETAALVSRGDQASVDIAVKDLGPAWSGGTENFAGGIPVSGDSSVGGRGAGNLTVIIDEIDRRREKRSCKQQSLNRQYFFHAGSFHWVWLKSISII